MIAEHSRVRPPVVLLCGGLGLRQRADGDDLPKPLRPLADGRALLLHVLDYYRAFGISQFILCVGYGADRVERLLKQELAGDSAGLVTGVGWCRLESGSEQFTVVDSGLTAEKNRRLLDARQHVGGGPFLLGYCDVLSDFDLSTLIARHEVSSRIITMVATRVRSRYGELEVGTDGVVTTFVEKPYRPEAVSAGYFMSSPTLFDLLDPHEVFESDVLSRLVERREVEAVVHEGLWLPLDTYKDFIDAEAFTEREGYPWLSPALR